MTETADSQARFAQADGLEVHEVPDGYVIYEQANERVHFLNPTAAMVFELCDGEHSGEQIQEIMAAAFELPPQSGNLAEQCLADLKREGLIAAWTR